MKWTAWSTLFAEMEFSGYRKLRRWQGPGSLVDLILVEAKGTGKPFGFGGRGRPFELSVAHVFEFANGRNSLGYGWPDTAATAAQLAD